MKSIYKRILSIPHASAFLWGPRQSGKTTLLRQCFPEALRIDLLKTEQLVRYSRNPEILRDELRLIPRDRLVVIDEIQNVPTLLNEVHYLIEEEGRVFVLCGSSARKVRRGHANLLGGRALRFELLGLSAHELAGDFVLERLLNHGYLPRHYQADQPEPLLRAYVDDYLKEEVLAEGISRNLPDFADFLRIAALGDTELVNFSNIARECGLAATTVRAYYSVLVDSLLGAFLPAYVRRPKRRVVHAPKFYFRDVGVVRQITRRGEVEPGSAMFGKAFENWVFAELSMHSRYLGNWYELAHWRLSSGIEVDFVLGDAEVAIEAKAKTRVTPHDLKGLFQLRNEYPTLKQRLVVCLEPTPRLTDDGTLILPYARFLEMLWSGDILGP